MRVISDVAQGVGEYLREAKLVVRLCTYSQYYFIIQNSALINRSLFIGIDNNRVYVVTMSDEVVDSYDLSNPNSLPMVVNCINDYLMKEYDRTHR